MNLCLSEVVKKIWLSLVVSCNLKNITALSSVPETRNINICGKCKQIIYSDYELEENARNFSSKGLIPHFLTKWFLSPRKEQNSWACTYWLCMQIVDSSGNFLLSIFLLVKLKFPNNCIKDGKYIQMNSYTLLQWYFSFSMWFFILECSNLLEYLSNCFVNG